MRIEFIFSIGFILLALLLLLIAGLSRHEKARVTDFKLLGELARVDTKLDPLGTVLVSGDLWRAKSSNGATISPSVLVRIVGFHDHIVVVTVCD